MASTYDLPVMIGALDLKVYKRNRTLGPMLSCNGGLHVHVLLLISPINRLKGSLADHILEKRELYAGSGRAIQRVHVRPVIKNHGRVVDYVLKTLLNGRLSYDDAVLLLPRSRGDEVARRAYG